MFFNQFLLHFVAHFPRGKTLVYKYYGDIKAGTIELAPYASQFGLESVLYIKHDISDPTLKNAYYVTLRNSKIGLHNGMSIHYQKVVNFHPIVESAKTLEKPFLVVYDENGKVLLNCKINFVKINFFFMFVILRLKLYFLVPRSEVPR